MDAPQECQRTGPPTTPETDPFRPAMLSIAFIAAVGLAWMKLVVAEPRNAPTYSTPQPSHVDHRLSLHPDDGPWSQIHPSRALIYHDCFNNLKCARLLVPLDWHDRASSGPEVAIAVIKRPAKVDVTDSRYGGAVLVNPGGPGGSGVQTILDSGERVQTIIDATREPNSYQRIESPADVYFDVIGFDPRGVNHSVPRLDCFPNAFNRLVWTLESDAEGYAASSSNALDLSWSRYSSRSKSCIEQINQQGNDSIAYYIGTRSVVEDMVAIVESHGEWREAEAAKLHNARKFILPRHEQQMQLAESHWQHGKEPILFWGTSYGTLLGATVAAIYPDRVQRMVLDSVLSPQFFYQMKLGDSLIHADTVFNQFARLCHKYGPDRCNFYRDTEKAITNDIDDLMSSLKSAPLAVPATSFRGPTSITWTDVNQLIGRSIYRPHSAFPMLATLLQNTFERNGSAFADYKASLRSVAVKDALDDMYTLSPQCKNQGPFSTACDRPNEHLEEILLAIQCGDGGMPSGMTKGQFRTYWESVRNASSAMGNMWAEYDMMCVGWTAKTKWKHDGSLSAQTAHPILFAGNRYDPVCPIENARKMAEDFPGSRVLQQDTIGHGILNSKSTCVEEKIRAYFQTGDLPSPDVNCKVELEPFEQNEDHHKSNTWRYRL